MAPVGRDRELAGTIGDGALDGPWVAQREREVVHAPASAVEPSPERARGRGGLEQTHATRPGPGELHPRGDVVAALVDAAAAEQVAEQPQPVRQRGDRVAHAYKRRRVG